MDDDDADYMQGSDDEVCLWLFFRQLIDFLQDYGFDYSDNDEANESGSADVENLYYTAKCLSAAPAIPLSSSFLSAKKEDSPEEALKEFRAIVEQEEEQGDWYAPPIIITHCRWIRRLHVSGGSRR